MNEETASLLEKLADKLGTTSNHLWEVLIQQANITAKAHLIQLITVVVFGIVLWRIHIFLSSTKRFNDNENYYQRYSIGITFPMILIAVIWMGFFIVCLCNISCMINGFYNPEYWALDRIFHFINGCGHHR